MNKKSPHSIQKLLRNWLAGTATPQEERSLFEEAQEDSFLKDALDGYQQNEGKHPERLSQLKDKLQTRYQPKKRQLGVFAISRIAAVAAAMLIGVAGIWWLNQNTQLTTSVAEKTESSSSTITSAEQEEQVEERIAEAAPSQAKTQLDKLSPKKDMPIASATKKTQKKKRSKQQSSKEAASILEPTVNAAPIAEPATEQKIEIVAKENTNDSEEEVVVMMPEQNAPTTRNFEPAASKKEVRSEEEDLAIISYEAPPQADIPSDIGELSDGIISQYVETCQGIIRNGEGEALIGATILEMNTNNGSTTDFDGQFDLVLTDAENPLLISYIGYQDKIYTPILGETNEIVLQAGLPLEEVIIGAGMRPSDELSPYPETQIVVFPSDGFKKYKEYMDKSLLYPDFAKDNNVEGTVVLEFEINKDGRPDGITIKNSLGYGCDQEAIRLLENGPAWKQVEADTISKSRFTILFKKE